MNFPYLSDGMWFLTQHRRWGLLKEDPDYLAVAKKVNQIEIYKQAAAAAKASVPKDVMRTSKLIDGVVWDGKDPRSTRAASRSRWRDERAARRAWWSRILRRCARSSFPRQAASPVRPQGPDARLRGNAGRGGNDDRAPRTPPPAWLVQLSAMALGLVVFVGLWAFVAKFGRIPDPLAVFKAAVRALLRPVLPQGPERPGHRLERAHLARARGHRLRRSRRWSAFRSAS